MKRTVLIAKCIDISIICDRIVFKFDKEIDIKSKYLQIYTHNKSIIVCFLSGEIYYTANSKNLEIYMSALIERFYNKYCLINKAQYDGYLIESISVDKVQLWQDLGNLENPELEEINCYIRLLNE